MIGDSLYCLIIESFRAFGLVLPVLGDLRNNALGGSSISRGKGE